MPSITFDIVTSNIQHLPPRPVTIARRRMIRARDISRSQAYPRVNFGQEIYKDKPDYRGQWLSVFADRINAGNLHEVPITFEHRFYSVYGVHTWRLTEGKKHVTPDRWITVVEGVTHIGTRLAFVNMHPASKPRLGGYRKRVWNIYHDRAAKIINGLVNQGYTVIYGGDLNRKNNIPFYHSTQQTLIESGLDHLYIALPKGVKYEILTTKKIRRSHSMDHPILMARVKVTTP